MKLISKFIFKITGWKDVGEIPTELKKAIFIIAPHTSNWDFFVGRFYCWIHSIPIKLLIKEEAFFWPTGGLLKKTGGIPVDRKNARHIIPYVVDLFDNNDEFFFGITPEGTRKLTNKWKMGFYYIAVQAKVPILLSYINYKKKEAGIGGIFYPTGDMETDLKKIEEFYRGIPAKHPELYNLR